jgi:hypothetical protein
MRPNPIWGLGQPLEFALNNLGEFIFQVRLARVEQPTFDLAIIVVGVEIHCVFHDMNNPILNVDQPCVDSLRHVDDEPPISKVAGEFRRRGWRQLRQFLEETSCLGIGKDPSRVRHAGEDVEFYFNTRRRWFIFSGRGLGRCVQETHL